MSSNEQTWYVCTYAHDAGLGADRFARRFVVRWTVPRVARTPVRIYTAAIRAVALAKGFAGSVVAGVHVARFTGAYVRSYTLLCKLV